MNEITLYTSSTCPYCVMARNFLQSQGLEFKEINIENDPLAAQELVKATGQFGVPQINVNGKWIVGFNPGAILQYVK